MANGKRTETEQDDETGLDAQDDTIATAGDDTVTAADDAETVSDPDPDTLSAEDTLASSEDMDSDASEPVEAPEVEGAPVAATPTITAHPDRQVSGPGFLPLLFGGILAAAIGYTASFLFYRPGASFDIERMTELTSVVSAQGTAIDELSGRLQSVEGAAPAEVDLSSLETAIEQVSGRIDGIEGQLSDFDTRLSDLEARPVLTGEAGTDEAAVAEAMDLLRTELDEQRDANEAMADRVQTIADEAEQRISDAEARAEASMGDATAQAALSELRIAVAAGTPFAAALADLPEAEGNVPPELAEVAETGIPTLEELQARFPAAARTALPVAIRETAGDTAGDRFSAFLRSQVGGRSLEPREGDDPDAILSRAGAAVDVGDLDTALQELSSLPEAAQESMADWIGMARQRAEALTALESLSSALGGGN